VVDGVTEFVLVRHGETVWHAENRYAGRSEVDLTEEGRRQGEHLAAWAAGAGLAAVVTSTLGRARRTAEGAAHAAGVGLEVDARLVEVDFGAAEGRTRAEMAERDPGAEAAFRAAPASSPWPGGEPGAAAVARALPALLERADRPGPVLVVGHQTLFRLLLCRLLGVPLDHYRRAFPRLDNAARTVVTLGPDGAAGLRALNLPTPGAR
jgi:broad specificity phosphatase PhoE